ncbi:DUF6080 domain-containing protein [Paenibacillus allorhizosphaerae]|uniref:YfhO family protein n=1 Tax=Paenibacillus allorhizosphaerae TaxID=2849866 RepID=A0ABM8VT12_9BACL|nr:DUF6080 domain-containing protein [Paenibacillus allorhizosphaerae]CAG7657232.1 hypothetical protein PAECIP111802_06663 [Paenibacillus allorhizosphaerae]
MNFIRFLRQNKQDNHKATILFVVLFLFYTAMNVPFLNYMASHAEILARHSPFYGAPFTLNLFNFDPSMYYSSGNTSIIHPFINFISGPLTYAAGHLLGNWLFAVMQSAMNALSAVVLYYFLRKSGSDNNIALLFSLFFGVSSYTIFTAMIPDSYPFAQFILIVSVLYLQYERTQEHTNVLPLALLGLLNFAVTSTNVIPFTAALLFHSVSLRNKKSMKSFVATMLSFGLMVVVVTAVQLVLFRGQTWITSWVQSLNSGGFSYVAPFSFHQHWKVFHMMVASPVLTPNITLIDPGITAFVTDLNNPFPIYVYVIALSLTVMAGLGFVKTMRSRETWTLVPFILFAVFLHIVVGFGLAAFEYDMYLYAGHYLFTLFLLSGKYVTAIERGSVQKTLTFVILIFVLVTVGNNILKHTAALHYIQNAYSILNDASALK